MIYLRLHRAISEEVDPEGSRRKQEQTGAISLLERNFARIAKFLLCMAISLHSEISLCSEILLHRKFSLC